MICDCEEIKRRVIESVLKNGWFGSTPSSDHVKLFWLCQRFFLGEKFISGYFFPAEDRRGRPKTSALKGGGSRRRNEIRWI
jgi:hypothetical protein